MANIFRERREGESFGEYTGYRLGVLRKAASLTSEELADKSGISVASVRSYERGDTVPLLETAYLLSKALGTDINTICGLGE